MITFKDWVKLNETFSFDPDADYADKTFGLAVGSLDSGKANLGGKGGDWDGSMPRALAFAKIANDFVGKNTISSQKRSREKTASGHTSDHYEGQDDSYAIDIATSGKSGDTLLAHLMQWCGHPEYKGGSWFNFNTGGYRYQVGWRVPDHFDHIHIGVRRTGRDSDDPKVDPKTSTGKTRGEKILNNQVILNWLFNMMPDMAPTLTPDELDNIFAQHPEHYLWFKDKFGLDDLGNQIDTPDLSNEDPDELIDDALADAEIKSNYAGTQAQNINILINQIKSLGVTNKYAIIGILSTIGKESNFIPQNELSYATTPNARIRDLFGSRVSDLSDAELTKLKSSPSAFFDKIYGPTATDNLGWNTGNTEVGDGYKYRGRGFNQLTFKSNYQRYSDLTGIDIVTDPDKLNDPKFSARVASAFIINGLKNLNIDPNSFTNKKSAIEACVKVNAGGSSAPSRDIAKAETIEKNFTLA